MIEFRALIIDDEAWTRDTVKRVGRWRDFGFRIAGEASDGASGLECVRLLDPDLIITDMKMPGIDGARLLQELHQRKNEAKIIVISGFSDYAYTRQALASHAIDYLLKPIDPTEFNAALQRCAEALRARRPKGGASQPPAALHGVDAAWLKEYQEAREGIRRSLDGVSESGLQESASRLRSLIEACPPPSRLPILIKLGFELFSLLEEHAVLWLSNDDPRFHPSLISYAVGEGSTARLMRFRPMRLHSG